MKWKLKTLYTSYYSAIIISFQYHEYTIIILDSERNDAMTHRATGLVFYKGTCS